ncbi:MAG: hypothetical protein V1647_01545 [Pseudomonadota bacterium]
MKNRNLFLIILGGALLRVICGYFVYGFIGFDEYYNGIEPAGMKLFSDHAFTYLDAARSPVLFYFDYILFFIANKIFNLHSPVNILRLSMMITGLISSATIYFAYRTALLLGDEMPRAKRSLDTKRNARYTALLFSFFFAMPFIQTRLMTESISAFFIIFGIYFIADKKFFFSGIMLAVAAMFRLHVSIIYITLCFIFIFAPPTRKTLRDFLFGGFLILLFQIYIDYRHSGGFLSSVIGYVKFQSGVFLTHSEQPWYNFLLLFIGLSIPIASIVTIPAAIKAEIKHAWLGIIFVVFVLFHSLMPHKEDRFMFPVIPIFLLLIGLGISWAKNFFTRKKLYPLYETCLYWFWVVNIVILVFACTSPTLTNVTGALDYARTKGMKTFISDSPIVPKFFTAYKGDIKAIGKDDWNDILCSIKDTDAVYVHTIFGPKEVDLEDKAHDCGLKLTHVGNFKSGYVDRILAKLNPSKNYRRANGNLYLVVNPKSSI